jgi:hypothetical protein
VQWKYRRVVLLTVDFRTTARLEVNYLLFFGIKRAAQVANNNQHCSTGPDGAIVTTFNISIAYERRSEMENQSSEEEKKFPAWGVLCIVVGALTVVMSLLKVFLHTRHGRRRREEIQKEAGKSVWHY